MTTNIDTLVRENIKSLSPYKCARDEYQGTGGVFLDANENPFGSFNRYPDTYQLELKKAVANIKQVSKQEVFIGNGSDEVIDLALRIFCEQGKDKVIICPPTYGMYQVAANINNVETVEIPLTQDFQLNINEIIATKAKMVFVCSPNNPTGNLLTNIEELLQKFKGIVFVDEAYIDFCPGATMAKYINNYANLIVSQTLSKAWGKAGLRIGLAIANKNVIGYFNKVKPPYNVSTPNQQEAIQALKNRDDYEQNKALLISERERLKKRLLELPGVKQIYPSDANFLLVEFMNANRLYNSLLYKQIIVRNRATKVTNCLRITVGTPNQNNQLIDTLQNINV